MLKNILNIEGVQEMNKAEQKSLQGGGNWGACTMKGNRCCQSGACYFGTCGRRGCFWR